MTCPRCQSPAVPDARFCAACGQSLTAESLTQTGGPPMVIDPRWVYPEPEVRRVRKEDPAIAVTVWTLVGVVVLLALLALSMGSRHPFIWITLATVGLFVFLFRQGSREERELRQKKSELVTEGVRCWGRILGVAHAGASTTVNGRSWVSVRITVEAFAAPHPGGVQPHAVGTQVADKVVILAEVSPLQFGLLIPGHYCAFTLHPRDPSYTALHGFVTAQGLVVARL
ncbi:hypothetical protein MFU01_70120 [Myxococcus fulvus]|uniref:Zinc-ribbon domain-containing protein n=2 Tax=Myxococcus fulvus TaxID=33 RepID=A0A511TCS3_MYXFU|nr:hypothetical protein MFU01_70120 [Myxococcus fulvus]